MLDPYYVIPAAGASSRYVLAGYTTPKPFLYTESPDFRLKRMMINQVINSVPVFHRDVFVGLPANGARFYDSVDTDHTIPIELTKGHADSVRQILDVIQPGSNRPIIVLDCDMILSMDDIRICADLLRVFKLATAVTVNHDPNAARVDKVPYPELFEEKKPISRYAIVSLRGFQNGQLLHENLRKICGVHPESSLTSAMNRTHGLKFAWELHQPFFDLGTPERAEQAKVEIFE